VITDSKNYCYKKTHKERDNYPSGGWCKRLSEGCVGKCDDCIKVNGKETGFVKK